MKTLALVLLAGCATPLAPQRFVPAGKTTFPAERMASIRARFPDIDALANGAVAEKHIAALAVGIVVDHELVYAKGFGEQGANADTVFRIGSITKTFTALAVLKLRDEGRLSLDVPAEAYLPELGHVTYPTRDSPRITLRHLLTHTSGLPALGGFSYAQSDHDVTEAEIVGALDGAVLETPPGAHYAYSNLGLGLVGLVVGRVAGEPYREYVTREILAPLGMNASRWSDRDVPTERLALAHNGGKVVPFWRLGAFEGAGGLYTSLNDLARYAAFQLAAYPARDDAESGPVARASVRESHAPNRDGVGLAWHIKSLLVAHNGGTEGHSASVQLLPEQGLAVLVLSNISEVEAPAEKLALDVADLLRPVAPFRTYEITPAMKAAVQTLTELYAGFTADTYNRTFTASFRAAAPAAVVEVTTQELRRVLGLCPGAPEISMQSARAGHIRVQCERGFVEYDVALTVDGLIADANAQPHP